MIIRTHGANKNCPKVTSGEWDYCKGHIIVPLPEIKWDYNYRPANHHVVIELGKIPVSGSEVMLHLYFNETTRMCFVEHDGNFGLIRVADE